MEYNWIKPEKKKKDDNKVPFRGYRFNGRTAPEGAELIDG